jgi:iron(III) transport system ATP-binding protein
VLKRAYLGGFMEYTLASSLGDIFVISPDVKHPLELGTPVSLHLADHGVSVVATPAATPSHATTATIC